MGNVILLYMAYLAMNLAMYLPYVQPLKKIGPVICQGGGGGGGGTIPETTEIWIHICSYHNFYPLSTVQTLLIPTCCLLCVL